MGAPDDAEALRRRLYSAGATAEDLAAYRGSAPPVAAPAPEVADAAEPAAPPPRPRRPRRLLGLVGGALVLVVVAALLLVLRPPSTQRPAATLPADAATTAEMIRNLRIGKDAGIAAYLVTNPGPKPIRSSPGYWTTEIRGAGPGSVRVAGPPSMPGPGRATVLLVLTDDADATWRATGADGDVVRTRTVRQRAGGLTSTTFAYPAGGRPVRLRVELPAGVAWGAAVVFTQ